MIVKVDQICTHTVFSPLPAAKHQSCAVHSWDVLQRETRAVILLTTVAKQRPEDGSLV